MKKASTFRIMRVQKMERIFDHLQKAIGSDPINLTQDLFCRYLLFLLRRYMDSGKWLRDYEADEKGLFPSRLKRGVLSQDSLYNFLEQIDDRPSKQHIPFAIETDRLTLREMDHTDFNSLHAILGDPLTMQYYSHPYSETETRCWIDENRNRYQQNGFGLWAVVLNSTDEMIGDCGLTLQNIDGKQLPEIGYHINKSYWKKGYATEAGCAVRDWAFHNTDYTALYSYMNQKNLPSSSTAKKLGMKKIKEYRNSRGIINEVYAITKEEWLKGSHQ